MKNLHRLNQAIHNGLQFLAREQETEGSFPCLVSNKFDDYRDAETVPAIVPTNIVLSSLNHLDNDAAHRIKENAAAFLLQERSNHWSFNYWFRKSDQYKKEPYPDDLDDTFCALAALFEHDQTLFSGDVLARIITMLTSAEKQEGGPYNMWLISHEERHQWNDVDLVVNSNIAFFLSLIGISLPRVSGFIEWSIEHDNYEFPYNTIYPAIYFISRFYKGSKVDRMVNLLLEKQEEGKWENPLRTALAVSSLLRFSNIQSVLPPSELLLRLESSISYLLETQSRNGDWESYSFYCQMRTKEKTLYAGSASITTALVLEVLHSFQKMPKRYSSDCVFQDSISKEETIYLHVEQVVRSRFRMFNAEINSAAEEVITHVLEGDQNREISLLPYYFAMSLKGSFQEAIPDDLVVTLGAASVFGWIAYRVYDDFLDKEGDPRFLPVANIALRESVEIFRSVLSDEREFQEFFRTVLDTVEDANAWEADNCWDSSAPPQYGNYQVLAEKSLGHLLGVMAILFFLGFTEDSEDALHIILFFKHYLIARQLNDDVHDWDNDLGKGHVNAVSARLLGESPLGVSLDELKTLFWERVGRDICEEVIHRTECALQELGQGSMFSDISRLQAFIMPVRVAAEQTLKEQEEIKKFLISYHSVGENSRVGSYPLY